MPTTPIYALPYPAASAPADVPADLSALALRAEATLAPARVTSLPGSPFDGQEVYYVATPRTRRALAFALPRRRIRGVQMGIRRRRRRIRRSWASDESTTSVTFAATELTRSARRFTSRSPGTTSHHRRR